VIIKKNKRGLVTPVSGSPEVDQGLTKKVLEYESSIECSQATTVSQGCGKNNQKKNQSIANSQSLSVKNKEQSHQTVQSEQLAQQR
jgi:hypothetical protein